MVPQHGSVRSFAHVEVRTPKGEPGDPRADRAQKLCEFVRDHLNLSETFLKPPAVSAEYIRMDDYFEIVEPVSDSESNEPE